MEEKWFQLFVSSKKQNKALSEYIDMMLQLSEHFLC